jgi:hypothetical protein
MDWLLLILGLPAILIPLVLLFGFAGCSLINSVACADDRDCPRGTRCADDGTCVPVADPDLPALPATPENLAAIALDDHSVSLTWTNVEPAASGFKIERAEEDGDFQPILDPQDLSFTGGTDRSGLRAGVTYIYHVQTLVEQEHSEFSDPSSATVFPAAPVNLVATPAGINRINLSWQNPSAIATDVSVERRDPGGGFREIVRIRFPLTTYSDSDPSLVEGTQYDYRVVAIVIDGVEADAPQEVKSAASAIVSATTFAFTAAFTAPPAALSTERPGGEGFCLVQRLSSALLAASGTQVRIRLRGSTQGNLTLDKITISQPATAATADPYDSGPDLTLVASGVPIAANTPVTVPPVNYALDRTKDLLVAFDISNTNGEGNLLSTTIGALTGADAFARLGPPEAGMQDRTTGYPNSTPATLFLIEQIDVV